MTQQELYQKYSRLIPNIDSIKDPEREVPRDILNQISDDIDIFRQLQGPAPARIGEGPDAPDHTSGWCLNMWRVLIGGGSGWIYSWDGAEGMNDSETQNYLQSGCHERCRYKNRCDGWLCRCFGGGMVRPGEDEVPVDIMAEEYTRMKSMWNYKMK